VTRHRPRPAWRQPRNRGRGRSSRGCAGDLAGPPGLHRLQLTRRAGPPTDGHPRPKLAPAGERRCPPEIASENRHDGRAQSLDSSRKRTPRPRRQRLACRRAHFHESIRPRCCPLRVKAVRPALPVARVPIDSGPCRTRGRGSCASSWHRRSRKLFGLRRSGRRT